MKGRFILRAKKEKKESSDTEVKLSHGAATLHPVQTQVNGRDGFCSSLNARDNV